MTCYEDRNGRRIKRTCQDAKAEVPAEIQQAAETQAASKGMLAGDLIAAMTKAIGIPACGGCEKRRQWLNRAHQFLASYLSGPNPAG